LGLYHAKCRPALTQIAPLNGTVYIHDTSWDAWARFVAEQRVRPICARHTPQATRKSRCCTTDHMNDNDQPFGRVRHAYPAFVRNTTAFRS